MNIVNLKGTIFDADKFVAINFVDCSFGNVAEIALMDQFFIKIPVTGVEEYMALSAKLYNMLGGEAQQSYNYTILSEISDELNRLHLEYRDSIPESIIEKAKQNNVVILHGYSDDVASFNGAINDESGCFGGGYVLRDDDTDQEIYANELSPWTYNTSIPHTTFNIKEDGELYCLGIVFFKPENYVVL